MPNGTILSLSGLPSWVKVPALTLIIIGASLLANWRIQEWQLKQTVSAVQAEKVRNDEQDRRFLSREEQAHQLEGLNKRLDLLLEEVRETRRRIDELYRQGTRPR